MRVISGKYKGRQLYSSKDRSIRPTTNKVKEYIFQILGERVIGAAVLDLFCGSGNLGIEALSRGAKSACFVDISWNSLRILKRNIAQVKLAEPYCIVQKDVKIYLRQNQYPFDLIFADPPFKWARFHEMIPLIFTPNNLCEEGVFVLESERSHLIEWQNYMGEILRQKQFDRSIITFSKRGLSI